MDRTAGQPEQDWLAGTLTPHQPVAAAAITQRRVSSEEDDPAPLFADAAAGSQGTLQCLTHTLQSHSIPQYELLSPSNT